MGQILIIEDDLKLASIYNLNLHMYIGSVIIEMTSFDSAKDFINDQSAIDLIVCKDYMKKEGSAKALFSHLKNSDIKIPFIIMGTQHEIEDKDQRNLHLIESPVDIKALVSTAGKLLDIKAKDMMELKLPELIPIKISYFALISISPCDIYHQITDPNGNQKFVKQFVSDYQFDRVSLNKLRNKKITELYILADYRLEFTDSLTSKVVTELNSNDLTQVQRLEKSEQTFDAISDMVIDTDGFNFNANKLTTACLNSVKKVVQDAGKLEDLLNDLMDAQNSYRFQHTQVLLYVAHQVIGLMEWGTAEQQDKMSFVAFFHDITLSTDEEVLAETEQALEDPKFTAEDIKKISSHASQAAQLVQSYERAPIGADTIIKQHHGSRNGIGFPKNAPNDLSPLAIVFIVAEEFTRQYLKNFRGEVSFKKIVSEIKNTYRKSQYQKVIAALTKVEW